MPTTLLLAEPDPGLISMEPVTPTGRKNTLAFAPWPKNIVVGVQEVPLEPRRCSWLSTYAKQSATRESSRRGPGANDGILGCLANLYAA